MRDRYICSTQLAKTVSARNLYPQRDVDFTNFPHCVTDIFHIPKTRCV